MNKPKITIAITTYNRFDMLKECINSILLQTFNDFDVTKENDYVEQKLIDKNLEINDHRIEITNYKKILVR